MLTQAAASRNLALMIPPRSRFVDLRGLRYHLHEWGRPGAPLLLMLHGWMDVGASFQFVVDALERDWHVLAPDWRGYGRTQWSGADSYWFPDYLADLEFLLDAVAADAPPFLIGHSMGGNIAMLYAGIRPQRARAVVNLEGFGLRDAAPAEAPARYVRWFDELKAGPRLRDYGSVDEVAQRLRQNNPRLSAESAAWLAPHWSEPADNGRVRIAGDPAHKIVNPALYRWPEVAACWANITCPVLWVEAAQTDALKWAGRREEIDARIALLTHVRRHVIEDAGHMLHHDQPAAVAALIEAFADTLPPTHFADKLRR
jgi:pimeloyl-ACP methyl ester carboxylesterase